MMLLPFPSHAEPQAQEYVVKAAYLYNFAKFVDWPSQVFATANSPLTLCLVGENPFDGALNALAGKSVRERRLMIRDLQHSNSADDCHMVFISASEQEKLDYALAEFAHKPVLTVSDIRGFADAGGMIGLVKMGQRVRFEVNIPALRQADLAVSSHLLKLARIIDE